MTKFSPGFGMRRPWLVLMNRIVGGWVGSDGAGATPPAPAARRERRDPRGRRAGGAGAAALIGRDREGDDRGGEPCESRG